MDDINGKPLFIYTDGSYNQTSGVGASAAVLLYSNNPNGRPMTYKNVTQAFKNVTSIKVELIAVYAGLTAINGKCSKITVFTDQVHLVNYINEKEACIVNKFIMDQIKKELGRKADNYEVKYLPAYSGNKFGNIAHNLANKARKAKENND